MYGSAIDPLWLLWLLHRSNIDVNDYFDYSIDQSMILAIISVTDSIRYEH